MSDYNDNDRPPLDLIESAIRVGDIDYIQEIVSSDQKINDSYLLSAIIANNIEIMELLMSKVSNIDDMALPLACKLRNYDIVTMLLYSRNWNCESMDQAMVQAIMGENMDIISLLVNKGVEIKDSYLECCGNNITIAQYLLDLGARPAFTRAIYLAEQNNNNEVLKLLQKYNNDSCLIS